MAAVVAEQEQQARTPSQVRRASLRLATRFTTVVLVT